jgi:GT2 family glycosyltransferase
MSAVVCTYRREHLALRAIASVLDDLSDIDDELIVVDQDPSGSLGLSLDARWPRESRLRYLYCPDVGLSHARNHAAREARGELIVFLDDDAVALPGWLAGYREAFSRTPRPDMVGGRILPEWESPRPRWLTESGQLLLGLYDIGDEAVPFPQTHLPVGANFGIRKQVLVDVGGFETDLGFNAGRRSALGGEDSLVARRVLKRGGLLLYQPKATARHLIRSDKLRLRSFLKRHFVEGRTQVSVQRRVTHHDGSFYRGVALWHAKLQLGNVVLLARAIRRAPRAGLQPVTELLASASLSAGAVRESLAILSEGMRLRARWWRQA